MYPPLVKRVLVKADLNQMELRVLAAITEDENMLEVFRSGGDLHINTAEAITGRKVEKGDPARQAAKAVNFGLSFGMGAKRFLEAAKNDYGVVMTLNEAKEAKHKLLKAYLDIGRWHQREAEECRKGNFETYTLMGRRRLVEPDYEGQPKFTERLNAPVQGTAADILKLAMARLWENREMYPDALPILTVHDEVIIECDAGAAPEVAEWLTDTLRGRSPTYSVTRSWPEKTPWRRAYLRLGERDERDAMRAEGQTKYPITGPAQHQGSRCSERV